MSSPPVPCWPYPEATYTGLIVTGQRWVAKEDVGGPVYWHDWASAAFGYEACLVEAGDGITVVRVEAEVVSPVTIQWHHLSDQKPFGGRMGRSFFLSTFRREFSWAEARGSGPA